MFFWPCRHTSKEADNLCLQKLFSLRERENAKGMVLRRVGSGTYFCATPDSSTYLFAEPPDLRGGSLYYVEFYTAEGIESRENIFDTLSAVLWTERKKRTAWKISIWSETQGWHCAENTESVGRRIVVCSLTLKSQWYTCLLANTEKHDADFLVCVLVVSRSFTLVLIHESWEIILE